MVLPDTPSAPTPSPAQPSLRRRMLKGMGALLGTGLLASPLRLLAQPVATVPALANALKTALGGSKEPIGLVKMLPGTTVPQGWALCNGQLLPAAEYPALFASLGAAYGGDGRRTFALPDLRNDMAVWTSMAAEQKPGGVPLGQLCVIKVANTLAPTPAGAELRLVHQRRPRTRVA